MSATGAMGSAAGVAAGSAAGTAAVSGATNVAASASLAALMMNGLSTNKYFMGILILLVNLGSRYIGFELSEFQHKVLNHTFARRLLIFVVIWMGTRDLVVSIVITTCFIVLVSELLNENSKYCILPNANKGRNITPEEYSLAKDIVQKYEKKQNESGNPVPNSSSPMGGMPGQMPPPPK
jgi:hypothetical protein